ncbi:MAG TPA: class I SAM-dependent methyltransferase [Polyangiaceae bacterium]|nr:class I SAM-dependent methyltransferase [Polyangiaceae bacterium]
MLEDPYDRLPYTDHAYAESHPNRLAVVARLSGFRPPELPHARVLEIGSARGGNLLPMAASLPEATLVGIDRSERQVQEAARIAQAVSLGHVTFLHASFESADIASSSFDFVICHGLYSWVSVEVRRGLLRAIGRWLAPGGIAYVSFNTLPGWYERLAARDWMRGSRGAAGDPEGKEALAALGWLKDQISPELDGYRRRLGQVLERLSETEAAYLVHEYLSDEHHPEHVETFLTEAREAGLAYLGDAIPAHTALELLPDAVRARAHALDVSAMQRTVDFVRCTSFRRALLVRADECAARGWRFPARLDPEALGDLRVASRLRPEGGDLFRGVHDSVQVTDGARVALMDLSRVAPRSCAFHELPGQGPELASELFDLWLATGDLDLYVHEPPMVTSAGDGATAAPLARWQVAHAGAVTNAWHQEVRLPDALVRFLLERLDGTRSLAELERAAFDAGLLHGASAQERAELVRAGVELLAGAALLVG